MCADGSQPGIGSPETAAEALGMIDSAADFLNGDYLNGIDSAAADLGGVLESLAGLSAKLAAARAAASLPDKAANDSSTPPRSGTASPAGPRPAPDGPFRKRALTKSKAAPVTRSASGMLSKPWRTPSVHTRTTSPRQNSGSGAGPPQEAGILAKLTALALGAYRRCSLEPTYSMTAHHR